MSTHLHTKLKETIEIYKQEKGKWEVKNPTAVFVDVGVSVA